MVSLPSFELFAEQDADYQTQVLGIAPRVGVEAAIKQGWDAVLDSGDQFVGMTGFGASGPAEQLYEHFGITTAAVIAAAARSIDNHLIRLGN